MAYRRKAPPRRFPRRRTSTYGYKRPAYKRRAPARRARKSTRTKSVCPTALTASQKFIMAQLDPFDTNSVNGAKIPDSNTIPSIANTDIDIINVVTSAVGTDIVGHAFRPQYTWGTISGTAGAAVNWGAGYVTNAANRSKRTAYVTAIELTRPVAHGIRISSPVAPTAASGFVHMALSTETTLSTATWQYPTTIAQMSNCQFYKRVTLASLTQSPITVINKWIDDTAFRYVSPNTDLVSTNASGFQTDYGWANIVIIVEGAPVSSTVLSVEHILLSEAIPQKDGVLIGSVAAANSPETMSAAGDLSTSQEPFHTEAEQDSYISRGISAVAQGAAAHGENVFNQVAVPLLQRVGQYGVNVAANMAMLAMTGRGGIAGVNNNANRLML